MVDTSNASINSHKDSAVSAKASNSDPKSDNVTADPTIQNNTSNTSNTIPMQNTGGPLIPLALSTLMIVGGAVASKIRKY